MLSQTAEYALRAVLCLARHHGDPLTTGTIAEEMKVPASYLSKVLQSLGRARLVRSQRGIGGGFVLMQEPEEITILDVMDAVDPINRIESCPLDLEEHCEKLCPLHRRLDAAIAEVRSAFGSTKLSEIISLKLSVVDQYDSRAKVRGARDNNDGRVLFSVLSSF